MMSRARITSKGRERPSRTMVRVILLVEDSVRYISSYLPILYKVILKQAKGFALEALNESPHPVITLSAQESGKETVLVVKDNGKGIADDQLDHIFIPFYSTREEGSGVGLSFSQHIMRMHRGRIHVQSREGEGTEIQLVFSTD